MSFWIGFEKQATYSASEKSFKRNEGKAGAIIGGVLGSAGGALLGRSIKHTLIGGLGGAASLGGYGYLRAKHIVDNSSPEERSIENKKMNFKKDNT